MKKIDLAQLYKKTLKAHRSQRKFVLFRRPNDNILQLYIDDKERPSSEYRFLIGSFNHDHTIWIHPSEIFYVQISKSHPITLSEDKIFNLQWQEDSLDEYIDMVGKALKQLNTGALKKVVLSRVKKIPFGKLSLKTSFHNLLLAHPESFVNLWYEPNHGLWMGATPELLFHIENKKLLTIALAGTLPLEGPTAIWTFKELEEHHMVLKYIWEILENCPGRISIGRTSTFVTGRIRHLKTLIGFSFSETPDFQALLHALHPTPAICGLTRKAALSFIFNHEGYDRAFYAGYIGTVRKDCMEIYVNLRCAKVYRKEIALYVGGGITAQSNPEKEWVETEIKAQNILSQLHFC